MSLKPHLPIVALFTLAVIAATTTIYVLACGPFFTNLVTVGAIAPRSVDEYERGDIGVVRPRFERRYLVNAYRAFSGQPLVVTSGRSSEVFIYGPTGREAFEKWLEVSDAVLGTKTPTWSGAVGQDRDIGNYQYILNCPGDAFSNAVRTLEARKGSYGAASVTLRDWTRAQVAVFSNCKASPLTLPEPAAEGADALVRADRAYQTAAALFYALEYRDAAGRFREIDADQSSPWRPYGRYLAARATLRFAIVKAATELERNGNLAAAEDELKLVLADQSASALHDSARGLIDLIERRTRPVERLHDTATILSTSPLASAKDLDEYAWTMDRLIGDTVDYDYSSVGRRREMVEDDDLTDWILAVQGSGPAAADRAITRWRSTRTPVWLVAALWKVTPRDPAVAEVLDASQRIERGSTYPTVAFLRVRLLIELGRRNEARALLATIPDRSQGNIQLEALNLLKAEKFMLARSLDELLASAPRATVVEQYAQPVFDVDAGTTFTERMPLDRLVTAATAPTLPARLRLRVAMAAWSRAVLLGRDDAGSRAAAVLRELAPHIARDVDRYLNAPTGQDRHRAAILLLLRTPGMHRDVRGLDHDASVNDVEPLRTFVEQAGNWWCGYPERDRINGPVGGQSSELIRLLYPSRRVPYPSFITDSEREAVERELDALKSTGPARSYLAREVLNWAQERPNDPDVPEALALAVQGWRFANCYDNGDWRLAERAFATLHQRYPQSEWTRRTRYWYK